MLRLILTIAIFSVIGFAVSYLVFAYVGDGEYISLDALFFDRSKLKDVVTQIAGIDLEAIRTKILASTGIGALIGAIVGSSSRWRKR